MAPEKDLEANNEPVRAVSLDGLRQQAPKFSFKVWLLWALGYSGIVVLMMFNIPEIRSDFEENWQLVTLVVAIQGVFGATIFYGTYSVVRKWSHRRIVARLSADALGERAETLQDGLELDFFNNLVKINFKYIDRYYLQTQIQADKSFLMSAVAAFVGLGIIAAGIVLMYMGKTEPAYVTTAAGLICEGIASLFFYLYNKTIIKMSDYHQKLVLTQNIGLALRITQDLPEEDRVKAQVLLAERLTADINQHLVGGFDKE